MERITIFLQSILTDMSTSLFLDKMKGTAKTIQWIGLIPLYAKQRKVFEL